MEPKLTHPLNACAAMNWSDDPKTAVVRELHPWNELRPIVLTRSGTDTEGSSSQLVKANLLIMVTLSPIVRVWSELHS